MNAGLNNLDVRVLVIDNQNPLTLYAGSRGIYKTVDGGENWTSSGLPSVPIVAMAINHSAPTTLYAAINLEHGCFWFDSRLFKSTDGGRNWGARSTNANGCDHIDALLVDPVRPQTIYLADFDHLFGDTWAPLLKSTDDGETWGPPSFNPPFACLAAEPFDHGILYAGTFDFPYFGYSGWDTRHGVFKSTDGGVNWETTGLKDTGVSAIAIDPVNRGTLYAATSSFAGFPSRPSSFRGLLKSTDNAATWFPINNGLSHLIGNIPGVVAIIVDPETPNVLYAGADGAGVYKSTNGGQSWSPFTNGLSNWQVKALALAPGNPNILYAGTFGGVFKITDPSPSPIPSDCANPIDCPDFFVRQHYFDFLNRAPDAVGLAYWTNEIYQCGADAACIHRRRIGVSAAFFVEVEFQETGYFVYRFYKASFGRQPNYTEFISDRSRIMDGTNLEVNKQAFVDEWVQRPAFVAAYPATMSNTEVVNKLFDSAGLTAPRYDALRQQEILAINAGRSRAMVLRDVIEISDFKNVPHPRDARYNELKQISQYNPAFVLMQYFGYLRRDVDQGGYAFWLDVLNNREPNDYRGMVCAFITSTEYQVRFGPTVMRSNADCGQ